MACCKGAPAAARARITTALFCSAATLRHVAPQHSSLVVCRSAPWRTRQSREASLLNWEVRKSGARRSCPGPTAISLALTEWPAATRVSMAAGLSSRAAWSSRVLPGWG
eukprot:scaffold20399_cov60-Phaeocystis_antarctica.AAC.11